MDPLPSQPPDPPDESQGNPPASLCEQLCADLVARWQRGERIPVEAYLQRHPELHEDEESAFELILTEVVLRGEHQEPALLEEYLWRFPGFAERLRRHFTLHAVLGDCNADRETIHAQGNPRPSDASFSLQPASFPVVPGFELLGELGAGAMGVVYRARQLSLNREVALKWILVGRVSENDPARFRTEAEALARLQHPNIVQIYDIGVHEGTPFLVFELVEGGSLADRLANRALPARAAAVLVETLAEAMHYAHERGIVHRDLKPANILLGHRLPDAARREDNARAHSPVTTTRWLRSESRWISADLRWPTAVKIADFGLAKLLDRALDSAGSGDVVGTPAYMAPEQAAGEQSAVGVAADVYALGAILYEVLTGRPLFCGSSPLATILQVTQNDPVPPSQLQPGLPHDLETICLKCLQKDPRRRYATALALAEDIARWRMGEPIQARPATRRERVWRWFRRHPLGAGLARLFRGGRFRKGSSTYQAILEEGELGGALAEARKVIRLQGDDAFGPPDARTAALIERLDDLAHLEDLLKRLRTTTSWQELLGPDTRTR